MRRWLVLVLLVALALPTLHVEAQRGGGFRGGGFRSRFMLGPGTPPAYDGRFTLARLYYGDYAGWSFDWPDMESHLGPHPRRPHVDAPDARSEQRPADGRP